MPETTPPTFPLTSQGAEDFAVSHFNATARGPVVITGLRYATPTPPGGRRLRAPGDVLFTGRPLSSAEGTEITVRGEFVFVLLLNLGGLGDEVARSLVGPYQRTPIEIDEDVRDFYRVQGFGGSEYDCFLAANHLHHACHSHMVDAMDILKYNLRVASVDAEITAATNALNTEHAKQFVGPTDPQNTDPVKGPRAHLSATRPLGAEFKKYIIKVHAKVAEIKAGVRPETRAQVHALLPNPPETAITAFNAFMRLATPEHNESLTSKVFGTAGIAEGI